MSLLHIQRRPTYCKPSTDRACVSSLFCVPPRKNFALHYRLRLTLQDIQLLASISPLPLRPLVLLFSLSVSLLKADGVLDAFFDTPRRGAK